MSNVCTQTLCSIQGEYGGAAQGCVHSIQRMHCITSTTNSHRDHLRMHPISEWLVGWYEISMRSWSRSRSYGSL